MKPATLLAGILCFFIFTAAKVRASAEGQSDSALAAAKAWVGQIDAGQYESSYAFGCEDMHDKVQQDRWAIVLKALRSPWGAVTSRKQVSHIYKGTGYEGTPGEFMVITYDSSFAKVDEATEVVVLKWEDNKWRGAGYNAAVKVPPPNDGSPNPQPTDPTVINTQPHFKPQSQ